MIRLSDEHWERIRDHFPEEHIPDGRPGRKPVPTRRVLEAVLWILNTGAQWHMLPQSYPNYKTVHRRFQSWCHSEVLRRVLTDVANELRDKGVLDEEESFIDAIFAMAKGGGAEIGPTKRSRLPLEKDVGEYLPVGAPAPLPAVLVRRRTRSKAGSAVLRRPRRSILTDVLALAGEDPEAVGEGVPERQPGPSRKRLPAAASGPPGIKRRRPRGPAIWRRCRPGAAGSGEGH
jgi:transposase